MKVKKQTVPSLRFPEFSGEWKNDCVGNLCDFIVPGRNKPKEFNGDIPWITTPDIEHNRTVYFSKNSLAISKEIAKKVGSKIVPVNSIIISCVGELGLVAVAGREIVVNQQLHVFIAREKINYRFLLYGVSIQKKYMEKVATKTAVPYMNKDNCNSIPITFPPLPEQQKIASFLTAVDSKIKQLSKKKALLEKYKKGMMQKLFSQELRFKDEQGNEFPDWEEKKLGELFEVGSGRDYKQLTAGSIPVYGTGGYMTSVNEFLYNGESVCIGRKGTIDKPMFLNGKFWTVDTLFFTHSFTSSIPKFIYTIFQTINWKKYNEASGVPSLSRKTIEQIKISIPFMKEQGKIADFLSSIDKKINLISIEINHAQSFKKYLLQQLFI